MSEAASRKGPDRTGPDRTGPESKGLGRSREAFSFAAPPGRHGPRAAPEASSPLWLWRLGCLAAVTAILIWRRPDAIPNPQLWAEDGAVFLSEASTGGLATLRSPYSGYYHVIGRLVGLTATWLPLRYAPHWFLFASWLAIAGLVVMLFSERLPFARWQKALMSLALVATSAGNDVLLNVANLATVTSFFWLLLAIMEEPRSKAESLFDLVLLAFTGLNTPFSIAIWPLFLLRWITRRTAHSALLFASSLVVAGIQLSNMFDRVSSEGSVFPLFNAQVADEIAYHVGYLFLGQPIYEQPMTSELRYGSILAVSLLYGAMLLTAARSRRWDLLAVLLCSAGAGALSLSVIRNWALIDAIHQHGRHFLVPAVTCAWAIILWRPKVRVAPWLPLAMIAATFVFFSPENKLQRHPDLDWQGHVSRCDPSAEICTIPINPEVAGPPLWFARVRLAAFPR